jgi:hypothetical protein
LVAADLHASANLLTIAPAGSTLLFSETLNVEIVVGMEQTMQIDMTETGNYEDGLRTYLIYYASEKERRRYARIFPKLHVPPHCEPPRRRDHLIP